MIESITLREKMTSAIDMQLKSNGNAIDLSGVAYVRLDMMDSESKVYRYTSVDSSAYLTIVTPSTGSVRFTPPDETIFRYQSQPYKLYIKVYTSSSQSYGVPEKEYCEIKLEKEY